MANIKTPSSGTYIGFKMGKTAAEADLLASTDNNLYITPDKLLYIQGERLALTDDEALYLKTNATNYSVTAAKLTLSAKSGYLASDTATTVNGTTLANNGVLSSLVMYGGAGSSSEYCPAIQISNTLTNPGGLTVTSTKYTMAVANAKGGAESADNYITLDSSTGLLKFPINKITTLFENGLKVTITCTITFSNAKTKAATFVFYIIPPIYTGVSADELAASSVNESDLSTYGLASQLKLSAKQTYTLTPTAANPYPVLLIPTACTLGNNWTMDGYGMSVTKLSIKDDRGQGYYIITYGKQSPSTQTITNS